MRVAVLAAGLVLIAGAVAARNAMAAQVEEIPADAGGDWLVSADSVLGSVGDFLGDMMGGSMRNVNPALVGNPNVRAFLAVIRRGEGTADAAGYSRLYGGGQFQGFADHPRRKVSAGGWTSTAAGAYQFLATTWDETRAAMGLPDFSPASQDLAAVGRLAYRGALGDVVAGNFAAAIAKCAREWASLPGSPYGQPTISMGTALATYEAAGGAVA